MTTKLNTRRDQYLFTLFPNKKKTSISEMIAMLWRYVVIQSDNYPRLSTPSFICRVIAVTTKLLVFFNTHSLDSTNLAYRTQQSASFHALALEIFRINVYWDRYNNGLKFSMKWLRVRNDWITTMGLNFFAENFRKKLSSYYERQKRTNNCRLLSCLR